MTRRDCHTRTRPPDPLFADPEDFVGKAPSEVPPRTEVGGTGTGAMAAAGDAGKVEAAAKRGVASVAGAAAADSGFVLP